MSFVSIEGVPTCILAKDGVYALFKYKDEREFESILVKNATPVFGSHSIYFDVKQKVKSKVKARVTDGLLLDLNDVKAPKFWIVEIELSRHDIYRSVEPQIRGFLRALKVEETLAQIRKTVYEDIKSSSEKMKLVRDVLGKKADVHYLIDKTLHGQVGIIIAIDEKTPELEEIIEELGQDVKVIEFKTYMKDGEHIYCFTPLPRLNHIKLWDERLKWALPPTKEVTKTLISRIASGLPGVIHKPRYRWHSFYTSEPTIRKNAFAVIMLGKKTVTACIRIDPKHFSDPKNLTRSVAGFFFPRGTERRLEVSLDGMDYAVELIKQSYEVTRRGRK